MNINELFFQSALINAIIFLWLTTTVAAARIFIRCELSLSRALIIAVLFGPFALVAALLFALSKKRFKNTLDFNSIAASFLVSLFTIAIFYWFFVRDHQRHAHSSEALIQLMGVSLIVLGFFGGLLLARLTRRVAFFEATLSATILAFYALSLGEWADEVFSYGTSAAYFSTLLLTATALFFIFLIIGGSLGYLVFGEGSWNAHFGYESFI